MAAQTTADKTVTDTTVQTIGISKSNMRLPHTYVEAGLNFDPDSDYGDHDRVYPPFLMEKACRKPIASPS